MREQILWITEDCFADCDFLPVKQLSRHFDIHWVVMFPQHKPRFYEKDFEAIRHECQGLTMYFFYLKYRRWDARNFWSYYRVGKYCKQQPAVIVYVNVAIGFPGVLALWRQLPQKGIVYTAHQGEVHDSMRPKWLYRFTRHFVYLNAKYVNMFSQSQARLFRKNYPKSKIHIIPLALKDFGRPTVADASGKDNEIIFLSFGVMTYGKHVDLLIDAACNLYEEGVRGFKVLIYGGCHFWSQYQTRIRYPEIFDLQIRHIANEELPNLFAKSHYAVQPYRIVTQSGVTKVAYNYCTPVIVSRLPGFMDEFEEGTTGFSFESENVKDLMRVMQYAIEHKAEYDQLKRKMHAYVEQQYSDDAIGNKYLEMFEMLNKKSVIRIE